MSLIAEPKAPVLPACPRVLIVDDEPAVLELVEDAFGRDLHCRLTVASSIREAKRILSTQPIELLVTDVSLPDGDGLSLIKALRTRQPLAEAIVITGAPSVDGAIKAMRHGAVDFLPKPFTAHALLERVRKALYRQSLLAKSEARIDRLKDAVRRLNEARRMVTKKVDLLCNDLVGAYGELSRQLDEVRTQESFRALLAGARDLEQLLCHAMDWVLRQLGYANVAVWLAGEEQFQLGAYMKYTIPGDAALAEAMRTGLLRKVVRDGFIHADASEARKFLSSAEAKLMPGQAILATHCTYLGESLAAVVLFREGGKPFTPEDAAVLKAIGPIFAVSLAAAVRDDMKNEDDSSAENTDAGGLADADSPPSDFDFDDDHDNKRKRRKKKDADADWWKNGGPPPF